MQIVTGGLIKEGGVMSSEYGKYLAVDSGAVWQTERKWVATT